MTTDDELWDLAQAIYDCGALSHHWEWNEDGAYADHKRRKYLAIASHLLDLGYLPPVKPRNVARGGDAR